MEFMKCVQVVAFVFVCTASTATVAVSTPCGGFFAAGESPRVLNPKSMVKYRELCNEGYAVGYSGITRTPLWSAERITAKQVVQQKGMVREGVFFADERIPASERAELADFARSGFDRGHLTPSASGWTRELQAETFALSNIVPQDGTNNRNLHASIEKAVREFALKRGSLYVITGVIFSGEKTQWINGRVAIPNQIFKLVYDPATKRAAAYLESNSPGEAYSVVSLSELQQLARFDYLPGVEVTGMLDLPKIKPKNEFKPHTNYEKSTIESALGAINKILKSKF